MFWPLMQDAILDEDKKVLIEFIKSSTKFTNGSKVREFELQWSQWVGVDYSVFVSSGSCANFILISAIKEKFGIKNGDKIILPMCTWATTIAPVIQLGLNPIFCDINVYDFSFSIEKLKSIAKKHEDIKIVFVTHLLGIPANIELYKEIFPNSIFIEDACESHGAICSNGKKAGACSFSSTFSFFYGHHMTCVEGGMVCTNDFEMYDILLSKRSHGMARECVPESFKKYAEQYPDIDPRFLFITDGFNFRNNEIFAVLGLSQLKRLDKNNEIRKQNYKQFIDIISQYDFFEIPKIDGNCSFCFPFVVKDIKLKNRLMQRMKIDGIETRPIISGNILRQPFLSKYKKDYIDKDIVANYVHNNGFYIGNNQFINSKKMNFLKDLINDEISSHNKDK
ncbi:MAG: DegT/DnrJ/EryC1/StrS aminotransferase family protein [bacterium]|nr:DegT/DnrJ/EryC1/StrS aminotransferase family protein [bacterium]